MDKWNILTVSFRIKLSGHCNFSSVHLGQSLPTAQQNTAHSFPGFENNFLWIQIIPRLPSCIFLGFYTLQLFLYEPGSITSLAHGFSPGSLKCQGYPWSPVDASCNGNVLYKIWGFTVLLLPRFPVRAGTGISYYPTGKDCAEQAGAKCSLQYFDSWKEI